MAWIMHYTLTVAFAEKGMGAARGTPVCLQVHRSRIIKGLQI